MRPTSPLLTGSRPTLARPAAAAPRLGRRAAIYLLARRWWVIAAAAVALAGVGLGGLRVWPPLATVMSASMAPTIETGDVVVLKHVDGRLHVGDIVAITVPDDARERYGYPPEVVHRIVRISGDGGVITKGDARAAPDPFTVPRAAVTAKVVAAVPAAGRLLAFLTSGLGLLWLAAGAVLLVVMPLADRQRDSQRQDRAAAAELRSHVRSLSEELAALRSRTDHDGELERRVGELIRETAAMKEQMAIVIAALAAPTGSPNAGRAGGLVAKLERSRQRARARVR